MRVKLALLLSRLRARSPFTRAGAAVAGLVGVVLVGAGLALQACSAAPAAEPAEAGARGLVPDATVPEAGPSRDATAPDAPVDPCRDPGPPLCAGLGQATWSEPTPVLAPSGALFAAISPDELHLAYYSVGDAGADAGSAPREAWVSDRPSTATEFPAGTALGAGYDPEGLALSADGLELVGLVNGLPRRQVRPSAGAAFSAPSADPFRFDAEGERFRAPVLGPAGTLWLGRVNPSDGTDALSLLSLRDGFYQRSPAVAGADLIAREGRTVVPTGISADLRTLFYYDASARVQRAAQRAAPGCTFESFIDLGARPGAQPNAACTALTYADPATGVATRIARR